MTLESGVLLQHERYQIIEQLGEGGMGTVYFAADHNLPGRTVAIKENDDTSPNVQAQFQREAVILARLSHPNLPNVTDHFIEPSGRQYLVMDYVSGDDLQRLTLKQSGFVPEETALSWIIQVCDALIYMHTWTEQETGTYTPVVHRDIKPSNIKCTPDGHVVLVDFGLAKFETSAGTSVGARAYTPGYAPIEQYTGGTDVRSDIYALGATFYSVLTSRKPPPAPSLAAGTELIPPRQINPNISADTEQVILRAMSITPDERYQSAHEMRSTLLTPSLASEEAMTVPLTLFSPNANAAANHRAHAAQRAAPVADKKQALPTWIAFAAPLLLVAGGLMLWYLFGQPNGLFNNTSSPNPATTAPNSAAAVAIDTATALPTTSPPTITSEPTSTAIPATASTAISATIEVTQRPLTATPGGETAAQSTSTIVDRSTSFPKEAEAGASQTNAQDGAVYLFIPAGEFTMGSDNGSDDGKEDEAPAHIVSLDGFWIMQTEVTNQQYIRCVDEGACTEPANEKWLRADHTNHPVTNISWEQASVYAAWVGGRLPTEAEWEKAARGDDLRPYPWGNEQPVDTLLNYRFVLTEPVEVGLYEDGASPYGVLDMAGNVEEWVQDWYNQSYYVESPAENPPGPTDGLLRIVRGGSFNSSRVDVRTTTRGKAIPTSDFDGVGFRVILAK